MSIGAMEPKFYATCWSASGLGPDLPDQMDKPGWPELKSTSPRSFSRQTRDEWCALLEDTDVCFAPVLS